MKSTKKIIPALAMLLVSAVMMATASFAWFAMNRNVSTAGMSVNIRSDSVYLLISENQSTNTGIQGEGLSEIENSSQTPVGSVNILPAAHKATVGTALAEVSNWYYKQADDVDASGSTTGEVAISSFDGYVVQYTFYVTLAEGSNAAQNLKVTDFTIAASTDSQQATGSELTLYPFRAVLACDNNMVELKNPRETDDPATKADLINGLGVLADEVTADTVKTIKVYLYYDGNDADVFTNNIINIQDVDFSFSLGVS